MTFNILSPGATILPSELNENFTHINYGNTLLPVDASGVATDGTIDFGSSASHWRDAWFGDGANVVFRVDSTTGKVGIGTSNPAFQFSGTLMHIDSASTSRINMSGASTLGTIGFSDTAATNEVLAAIESEKVGTTGGKIYFNTQPNGGSLATVVTIDSVGKLGVGIAPSYLGDFAKSSAGATNTLAIRNTSTTGASDAQLLIQVAATGDSDPLAQWSIASGQSWYAGIDNSDSDSWKLSKNSDLSTHAIKFDTSNNSYFSGSMELTGNLGVGGSAPSYLGDFAKSSAGATNTLAIRNTNTTNGSHSKILVEVADTGSNNPTIELSIASGKSWYLGIDDDDSDNFKISDSSDLSAESLEITSSWFSIKKDTAIDGRLTLTQNDYDNADVVLNAMTLDKSIVSFSGLSSGVLINAISGTPGGSMILVIINSDSTFNVTVQNGTNIKLAGSTDVTLGQYDTLTLIRDTTADKWIQIGESNH